MALHRDSLIIKKVLRRGTRKTFARRGVKKGGKVELTACRRDCLGEDTSPKSSSKEDREEVLVPCIIKLNLIARLDFNRTNLQGKMGGKSHASARKSLAVSGISWQLGYHLLRLRVMRRRAERCVSFSSKRRGGKEEKEKKLWKSARSSCSPVH